MRVNELTESLIKKYAPEKPTRKEKSHESLKVQREQKLNEARSIEYVCTLEFESEEARDQALKDALNAGLDDKYEIEPGDEITTLYVTLMSSRNEYSVLDDVVDAFDSVTQESIEDSSIDGTGFSLNESVVPNEVSVGDCVFNYTGRDGWQVKSNKTGKEYSLGELKSYEGTSTTDIVIIFDYEKIAIVDFFFGAGNRMDMDLAKSINRAIIKYEGGTVSGAVTN